LKLVGGIRQSYDRIAIFDYNGAEGDSAQPTGIPTIVNESRAAHFSNTSFEGGINWKPSNSSLIYATYKQGYRTGAFNGEAVQSPAELTTAPPETTESFELGAKFSVFDRRLTVFADVFQLNYKNQQVLVPESSSSGTVLFPLRSLSRARVRGVEVSIVARPTPALKLEVNASALDPVYTNATVQGVSLAGKQMTNASRYNVAVNANYTIIKDGNKTLSLNGNAQYRSRQFFDVYNSLSVSQNGYWLVDGRLSYEIANYTISGYVKNATNTKYTVYSFLEQALLGWDYVIRGSPRTYGLEVGFKF
jgi:iron complex outermembrane receptor protein